MVAVLAKSILRVTVLSALAGAVLAVVLGSLAPTVYPVIDHVPWRDFSLPSLISPVAPGLDFDLPFWRGLLDS